MNSVVDPVASPLADWLAHASLEVTPRQVAVLDDDVGLTPGTAIYVPFLPGADFADSITACQTIQRRGWRAVPHLPARAVTSRNQLEGWLARLAESGVDSLLLIAGDVDRPHGPYPSTLEILDSGLLQQYGLWRIGVAGHPEGHPRVARSELDRALLHKAAWAEDTGSELWLVTQFAFSAEPIHAWLDHLDQLGIRLPVWVGLPGPAKLATLLRYAVQCGVGNSLRTLMQHPSAMQLLRPWSADALLESLTDRAAIRGIHIFPFGGPVRAVRWLQDLERRQRR